MVKGFLEHQAQRVNSDVPPRVCSLLLYILPCTNFLLISKQSLSPFVLALELSSRFPPIMFILGIESLLPLGF